MGARANLSSEEGLGLGIAAAAHVALLAALVLIDKSPADEFPKPQEITVSLADEVSLQSTAPDPSAAPQAAIAPVLSPEPAPEPLPEPEPAPRVAVREPEPAPAPKPPPPRPTPAPRATAQPRPTPAPSPTTARPRPEPQATREARRPEPQPTRAAQRSGGSRIGADFLEGSSAGERSESRGTPAATFGPAEQASLSQAINRQLKPHWSAPQGVDAELLVTVLSWELNPDGSLKGTPRVVSQSGINDSNRPQARLHAERAIRAVQLAAPFNLPEEFYDRWKRVSSWSFDRKL